MNVATSFRLIKSFIYNVLGQMKQQRALSIEGGVLPIYYLQEWVEGLDAYRLFVSNKKHFVQDFVQSNVKTTCKALKFKH